MDESWNFIYSLGLLVSCSLWPLELFFFLAVCAYVLSPVAWLVVCYFKETTLDIIRGMIRDNTKFDDYFRHPLNFLSDYEREN